ncbi:MAG: hypothetical protein KGK08_14060 [Acidobacteriota bacterium]|nr:hypothetical protein [Acidobacteriota bacterium]
MSTLQVPISNLSTRKRGTGHRIRVLLGWLTSLALVVALAVYGADYYRLPLEDRPYSAKYELLKPGGIIGLKLGILGTVLFCIIFLYALRKVIPLLSQWGTARQWMDFHVIAGVTAPVVIAFHASFKFRGIAGIAFWIMLAVALSGIIGRYLYSQIPRSISAAELSMAELKSNEAELTQTLLSQSIFAQHDLDRLLRTPSQEHLRRIGSYFALLEMMAYTLRQPFVVAALRRKSGGTLRTLGGMLPAAEPGVENIIQLAAQKSSLSRRIVFLDHTHKIFHLWHVIHRPFSYAFAVLALLHIAVVMGLGFMGLSIAQLGMH